MAALLPGMQYMLDQMETAVEQMRAVIRQAQQNSELALGEAATNAVNVVLGKKRMGRPPGSKTKTDPLSEAGREAQTSAIRSYWSKLTPAERSAEMLRRQQVHLKRLASEAKGKNTASVKVGAQGWAGMTPAERSVEMKRRMAKRKGDGTQKFNGWAGLSKAEHKRRVELMLAGRAKKQAVNGAVHA